MSSCADSNPPVNRPSARPAASFPVYEHQLRARLKELSYLPTSAAVASKFLELGRNPDADPGEYSRVISADPSLSVKVLALANSSWFGVRNRVTKINYAVNLLGLGTVRTLALSYCVTGLHQSLRLSSQDSSALWTASLCKAVVAKQFISLIDPKLAEEAFAMGLFQDLALPVMCATGRDALMEIISDSSIDCGERMARERALFGMDHGQCGRAVALKLELPELFVADIAFHHCPDELRRAVQPPVLANAALLAALFPHAGIGFGAGDANLIRRFITEHGGTFAPSAETFLETVQQEFDTLYRYFGQGEPPEARLAELLEKASSAAADNTQQMVLAMQDLMQQVASSGQELARLAKQQSHLAQEAEKDPLTGILNRQGLERRAAETLAQAGRYGVPIAIAFVDVDRFKLVNDSAGHATGDDALKRVVSVLSHPLRESDLVARLGGDEFVVILYDYSEEAAKAMLSGALAALASRTLSTANDMHVRVTASCGLLHVKGGDIPESPLDKLLPVVDQVMYAAKRAGGNRVQLDSFTSKAA